jgi:signal transduction histidine kinase
MLQRANYQIQRRALQLEASLEVSKAVTSIRDPGLLLNRVVELISDRFLYTSVAVYLLEPGGGQACLQARSPVGNQHWPESVHPGDGTLIERALRKGEPQVEHEEYFTEERWHRRTLSRMVVPLRMEARVTGAIAVLSAERESFQEDDVEVLVHLANQVAVALENARAYERERRAAKQMEDAEAFKTRFLANMSHDLREPLNSIIGFSRLMLKGLDGPLSSQQRGDVQRIYENSQRLLDLINDILTISEIQAGLMELHLQPVDLGEVVTGVLPTARALVRGKEVELVQDIPESLPPVRVDAGRIRQVLVHLLSNAAQFTEKGQIGLKLWADDEQAYVSVSDTGMGISEEDSERIFARFEKGANGRRRSAGMGLGLALTKEFVEMHGGRIWFTSERGQGSTFTFSLPLRPATEEKVEETQETQEMEEPEVVRSTAVRDGAGGGT